MVSHDLAAVLLQAEKPPLVLLEHSRVVVDLALEQLAGSLCEQTGVGGSAVEE